MDSYDVGTGKWTSESTASGQLSVARSFLAAAGTESIILFAGGMYEQIMYTLNVFTTSSSSTTVQDTVDIYSSVYGMYLGTTALASTSIESTTFLICI